MVSYIQLYTLVCDNTLEPQIHYIQELWFDFINFSKLEQLHFQLS